MIEFAQRQVQEAVVGWVLLVILIVILLALFGLWSIFFRKPRNRDRL